MTEHEIRIRKRLRDDFLYYAEKNLKIRAKKATGDGDKIVPFTLNRAQEYIHARLEDQRVTTGKVRALILKGRQQGCSTLIGARYYWRTTHRKGLKTFILTHLDDATNNLFNMVKRYHEHCNPLVKPSTSKSNRKELVFDRLDSAYGLGTAGSGSVGRSDTIDLFHGSEVAFWKNPDDIKTGVLQAANAAEEVILESTANGFDPIFYSMWDAASKGESDYQAIFVPWFWQSEYEEEVPAGTEWTADELEILSLYGEDGMSERNLLWRRKKLANDFKGDTTLFKQEYPCAAYEAFQVTGLDPFISPDVVIRARKNKNIEPCGAHIVGLDPARGGDSTAFFHRQGRVAWKGKVYKTPDTRAIKGEIKRLFTEPDDPARPVDYLVMDTGGLGGPIYDDMRDWPFFRYIIPVNFGAKDCYDPDRYLNRKAEMAGGLKDWLSSTDEPVSIPDCDALQAEICAEGYSYDDRQRIKIESKESLAKRGIHSPDQADALKLTFAQQFAPRNSTARTTHRQKRRLA